MSASLPLYRTKNCTHSLSDFLSCAFAHFAHHQFLTIFLVMLLQATMDTDMNKGMTLHEYLTFMIGPDWRVQGSDTGSILQGDSAMNRELRVDNRQMALDGDITIMGDERSEEVSVLDTLIGLRRAIRSTLMERAVHEKFAMNAVMAKKSPPPALARPKRKKAGRCQLGAAARPAGRRE